MQKYRRFFAIPLIISAVAAPAVVLAGVIIIHETVWPTAQPQPPATPAFTDSDFAAAHPLETDNLASQIEAATGEQFHVAGPVTMTTGPLKRGTVLLSVPVSFATVVRADEDEEMGHFTIVKGTMFHKQVFAGLANNVPTALSAWCGSLMTHSWLGNESALFCLVPRRDGNVAIFSSDMGFSSPIPAKWYPNGINMQELLGDSEHYPFPKLTPVESPAADMTLEVEVNGGRKAMSVYWRLCKSGESNMYVFANSTEILGPNFAVPTGPHYVYPLGNQWLGFDYDLKTKQISSLGVIATTGN